MNVRPFGNAMLVLSALFGALLAITPLRAQTTVGSLRGQVTDPSGAAVTSATVLLTTPSGDSVDTTTNKEGIYEFKNLTPGKYAVKAVAQGFAVFTAPFMEIVAGQQQKLNIAMKIEDQKEEVLVSDTSTKVDIDPANNAGAVVLRGKDLDALSDDPDELQSELQALAGPSAGPNGGQIYIDGFTAGQLPPKASIREIRVNQNPFSSEYDKLGYGRIEILTKPGTDQFHGQITASGNSSNFNARNPFEVLPAGTPPPGYETTQLSANVGGPLSKKASFFFNFERRDIHDLSIISTPYVDPTTFQITQLSDAVANPKVRMNLTPRLDYQLTPTNTLTARYQYFRNTESSDNVGPFALAPQGTDSLNTEHTLQVSDTQTLSATTINETRFQFVHVSNRQTPVSVLPAISVVGAFSSGGNTGGLNTGTQNDYELQNTTYRTAGKHSLKFGGRLRARRDGNNSNARFNSAYTFSSLQDYRTTLMEIAGGTTTALPVGPSYYSLSYNTAGTAHAEVTYFDAGLFVQDDWRIKPNITFSYGLRYEGQNYLSDHVDLAPRFGLAWGIGGDGKNKAPKTVLRAGWGIFYDRFNADLVLHQELQNGVIQQNYLIQNPGFFNPAAVVPPSQFPNVAASPQTTYRLNPNLRTPYTMQTGISMERQLGKFANVAVTYLNSRGNHQFYTQFINPNLPGQPPPSQIFYEYQSEGVFKQNQFIVNSSIRLPTRISVSLFGYYTLNYASSDTSGAGSIPSIPTNLSQDYGRAAFDTRQRLFLGGSIGLPKGFRVSPFLIASSGSPFNITTGKDVYGDSAFNTRPYFASCSTAPSPNVVQTKYGCFSLIPNGAAAIPIYDATGPDRFVLNMRLSKTIGFGQKLEGTNTGAQGGPDSGGTFGRGPGGGGRGGGPGGHGGFNSASSGQRYSLTFSVSAQNIFNNVNLGNPTGNLSSPLFGMSNSLAGRPFSSNTSNRRIDVQVTFSF